MGSFVTLDIQCLSTLLESCHNCTSGKVAEVSIAESLAVRVGTDVIRPITFLCCGLIINAEGAIFWHSDEITSESIASAQENDHEHTVSENEASVSNSKKDAFEDVIVKCEEKATEKVDNEEDSVKILIEEDPLLLDASSNSSHNVKCTSAVHSTREGREAINSTNNYVRTNLIGILSNQDVVESVDSEKVKNIELPLRKKKYPDMFTCEFCGKNFTGKNRAYLFYYHRNREHTQAMVFRCEICLKDFFGDRELLAHMSTHKDPGHVCHICGKKLSSNKHLKTHLLVHEPAREHICEFCDKTFRRKDHLKVHERIHTGERPYQCKLCGSAYPQKHQLKLHFRKCPNLRRNEGSSSTNCLAL